MTQVTKSKRQRLEMQAILKARAARDDMPLWYTILRPFILIGVVWSIMNAFIIAGNVMTTGFMNLILLLSLRLASGEIAGQTILILSLSLVGAVISYALAGFLLYTVLDVVKRCVTRSEIPSKLKHRLGLLVMLSSCLLTSHLLLSNNEGLLADLEKGLKAPTEQSYQ